jgi:hypothetical protein
MSQPAPLPHSQRVAIPLTVVVALLATVVAYLGTREVPPAALAVPASPFTAATVNGNVRSIVLPRMEVELPAGPHQKEFVVACTTCHSAHLVLNQPPFAGDKWSGIVKKMVKTYGAPIAVEGEPALVEYLTAIRGKPQP